EDVNQHCDQLGFLQDGRHDVLEWHRDRLGSLQGHSAVHAYVFGSTKLADDVAAFAHVVNHLTPIRSHRSQLYKTGPEEEERPLFAAHIVDYVMLVERLRFPIGKDQVAEPP